MLSPFLSFLNSFVLLLVATTTFILSLFFSLSLSLTFAYFYTVELACNSTLSSAVAPVVLGIHFVYHLQAFFVTYHLVLKRCK